MKNEIVNKYIMRIYLFLTFPFVIYTIFPFSPQNITEPEDIPKIIFDPLSVFDAPSVKTESMKYHLDRRSIFPGDANNPFLIKEFKSDKLTAGIEGMKSTLILQLWLLNTDSIDRMLWSISHEAHTWQYANWEEIVLIKYGCCDSPNEYSFYDLKTGKLTRKIEATELPE